MNTKYTYTLAIIALWAGIFAALHHRFTPTIETFGFNAINSHLAMNRPEPAGEIVTGFELRTQLAPLDPALSQAHAVAPVCVALLMATYGDRENKGSFQIAIEANGKRQSHDILAGQVEDNRMRVTCFEQMHYQDLANAPGILVIRGVDGKLGSAVTAWLSNADNAPKTWVNGKSSKASLVHALGRFLDSSGERLAAWALMVAGSLVASIILVAGIGRSFEARH